MTIQEAIEARHSVRVYKDVEIVKLLEDEIVKLNNEGQLHIQLICNEPKAFQGTMAKYGKFRNANNYLVMAGRKADDLDERIGYYGEHLVLLAQTLGLNSCCVGLSYSKVPGTYVLDEGEKIACYIAIGYGETQGASHKIKTVEQVSNATDIMPTWFKKGVETALLAPTAVNQQKFSFEYVGMSNNRHHDDTHKQMTKELAALFPAYVNSLNLRKPDGTPLRADNYLDYLKSEIIRAAQIAKNAGADIPDSLGFSFTSEAGGMFAAPVNGGDASSDARRTATKRYAPDARRYGA